MGKPRLASVRAWRLNRSPEAVCRPWNPGPYQVARPTSTRPSSTEATARCDRARRMADGVLAPRAADADDLREFQHGALEHLRRAGFLSLAVPEWHGGQWVDHVTYALVMEALGEGDASITCCLAMHFGCAFHIL